MSLYARICATAAMTLLCVDTPASAQGNAGPLLTVRVYNPYGVRASELRGAKTVAKNGFGTAGVSIEWRDCKSGGVGARPDVNICEGTLSATELIVRLIHSPGGASTHTAVLGYSSVDKQTRSGSVATIYGDRVAEAAIRISVDRGTLLGRVVAHELGHLLGAMSHTDAGLMRERWPYQMLRGNVPIDWLFTTDAVRRIVATLHTRARHAPAAQPSVPVEAGAMAKN